MTCLDYARPIDERPALDRATFEREVAGSGRPVVLRGLVADWPAVRAGGDAEASAAYLLRFPATRATETFLGMPEIRGRFFYNDALTGFNYARRELPLQATIEQLVAIADDPHPPAIYAGAAAAPDVLPGFTAANPMPLLDADVLARIWIGNAVTVSTHHDLSANIACVVAGRRQFLLFPPDQVGNLYIGPLDFTMAGRPVSMVDPESPDLVRYPRFAEAMRHALVADLAPGDAIYMPPLWWHQVRARAAFNVLVNYWWGEPAAAGPFEAMLYGLLAIRDLPADERAAWRQMFDHYVFDGATAGAHLPVESRGVLAPASPQRAERIRGFLMNALSRLG